MSNRRLEAAARLTRDFETRACQNEPRCVNRKCDGTRHFDMGFRKWGSGWAAKEKQ